MIEQKHGGSMVFIGSISAHRVNFPQPQADYVRDFWVQSDKEHVQSSHHTLSTLPCR